MDPKETALIEQSCIKLVNQFANYNDAMRYEELAELFTEEASFARPTDPENYTVGKEQILAAFLNKSGAMCRSYCHGNWP